MQYELNPRVRCAFGNVFLKFSSNLLHKQVVLRSREGLENFEDYHGPNIEICEGDEDDHKSVVEGGGGQLIPSEPKNPAIMFKFTEEDLNIGVLAPMGPNGLDILKLCSKCCLLTYQVSHTQLTKH